MTAARAVRRSSSFKTREGLNKLPSWDKSVANTYWVRTTTPLLQRRANPNHNLSSNLDKSAKTPPTTHCTPPIIMNSPISKSNRPSLASNPNERSKWHRSRVPFPAKYPRMKSLITSSTSIRIDKPPMKSSYRSRVRRVMSRSGPPSSNRAILNMGTSFLPRIPVFGQRISKIRANPGRSSQSSSAMSYWRPWNDGSSLIGPIWPRCERWET